MGAPGTQRLPAEQRRELLLTAAAELFAEHGYYATDVASIAAAAGVTKVIAYRAFGSKQAIYQAVLDRHRDELLGTLIASQQREGPSASRVRDGLEAWFGYVQNHPFAWRLLFRDTTGLPELEERHRQMRANARHVITRLLSTHLGVDPSEAPATAEFLRAGIVGMALWWLEHTDIPRTDIVASAERLLRGALNELDR